MFAHIPLTKKSIFAHCAELSNEAALTCSQSDTPWTDSFVPLIDRWIERSASNEAEKTKILTVAATFGYSTEPYEPVEGYCPHGLSIHNCPCGCGEAAEEDDDDYFGFHLVSLP